MVRILLMFMALASLVACRQLSAAQPAEVEIDWPESSPTKTPAEAPAKAPAKKAPAEAPAPSPNDTRPE